MADTDSQGKLEVMIWVLLCVTLTSLTDHWSDFVDAFKNRKIRDNKKLLFVLGLTFCAWIAFFHQRNESEEEKRENATNTMFLKAQLTNSTALVISLNGEVARLRKQSDSDMQSLVNAILNTSPLSPESRAVVNGIFALVSGREKQAEMQFNKAIRLNPSNSIAHNNLGNIYHGRGNTELATMHYKAAYEANTNNFPAIHNYARALYNSGNAKDAANILPVNPDFEDMGPEAIFADATKLVLQGRTNFWAYLNYYIQRAESPNVDGCMQVLASGWTLLPPTQRSASTNWLSHFQGEDGRKFALCLDALKIIHSTK